MILKILIEIIMMMVLMTIKMMTIATTVLRRMRNITKVITVIKIRMRIVV